MKRSKFLRKISGLGIIPILGLSSCNDTDSRNGDFRNGDSRNAGSQNDDQLKQELIAAWYRSEKITLISMEQMLPESYFFKYTDEAMTFSEQWRHCVVYTCGQLAGRTGLTNPYEGVKLPVQMPKDDVISEIKKMYSFVRESILKLSTEQLRANCEFAGEDIPVWRLFYALENHIIHHRGQCVVYLRLNGIKPKGYYGW
ncbi:MAG: DinB family protein [Bacteroidota bacterium]